MQKLHVENELEIHSVIIVSSMADNLSFGFQGQDFHSLVLHEDDW